MTAAEPTPDIPSLLRDPDTTVAVVGATDDPAKYGGRIYRDLKAKGFTVYAVNPNRDTVDGDPAWPNLADLPAEPTIVDLVVPSEVGLGVLREAAELNLTNIWVQPGAESEELLDFAAEHDLNTLANACIMVEARHLA